MELGTLWEIALHPLIVDIAVITLYFNLQIKTWLIFFLQF